jgi:hypothetical protein
LFTFPEQLPGPARFGKGRLVDAVLKWTASFVEDPLIAARCCSWIWDQFQSSYSHWLGLGGEEEYWIRDEAQGDIGLELSTAVAKFCRAVRLVNKRRPDVFGVIDVQLLTDWSAWLGRTTQQLLAHPKATHSQVKHLGCGLLMARVQRNLQDFIDAVAWNQLSEFGRGMPEGLSIVNDSMFYSFLLNSECSVSALQNPESQVSIRDSSSLAPPPLPSAELPNPSQPTIPEVEPPEDGIDESVSGFRWDGREILSLTPTGFDVLKAMWEFLDNPKRRVRRVDVATFLPERMVTWDFDPNLKNFSKYQTEILKAFEAGGLPAPWEYNGRARCYVKSAFYCGVDTE